jgi:hypothetical protein
VPGRAHHLGGAGVLADKGRRAGLHGREDLVVAGMHRKDHGAGRLAPCADRADDVEPTAVGHLQVSDDDVGIEAPPERNPLGYTAGLAHDGHAVLALERACKALADELVVVNQ